MHVVIFNVLGSGHVNPTLPTVRALVARGDRVTYFTYPERRAEVVAAGATFEDYGRDDFRISDYHERGFPSGLFPATAALMPYLIERMAELKPDRIIADMSAPWGAAVAQVIDVPFVLSHSSFAFGPRAYANIRRIMKVEVDPIVAGALATLRDEWGVTFDEADFPFFVTEHNVVYTGRLFNPPLTERQENFHFVGPMIAPRPDESGFPVEHYAGSTATRVLISMGTVVNNSRGLGQTFYQPFFDALGGRDDVEVILGIGADNDPDQMEGPANFRIERFVPQLALLPHIDIFVTHGGMNSANEALYHGVPLIVTPFYGDQHVTAERVEALGAGLVVDPDALTAEGIRSAVERLVGEPRYAEGAAAIKADLRAGDGVAGVLSLL